MDEEERQAWANIRLGFEDSKRRNDEVSAQMAKTDAQMKETDARIAKTDFLVFYKIQFLCKYFYLMD